MFRREQGIASQLEPQEPSISLLLLGYICIVTGISGCGIELFGFRHLEVMFIILILIYITVIIFGIWLLRRDNRLLREFSWSQGQDYVEYILGYEIRRCPPPKPLDILPIELVDEDN